MANLKRILDTLESAHGAQSPQWPTDPYPFLLWWHCGYPPSLERCSRGWQALRAAIGTEPTPAKILATPRATLARALRTSGLVPLLRADRIREVARRVQEDFGGDLAGALRTLPAALARRALKEFPGIGNPGADRILLFAGIARIAAVPSNCAHVLVRIAVGREPRGYDRTYALAQRTLERLRPRSFQALTRAYLLLQAHGRQTCKAARPRCEACPIARGCAHLAAGEQRR
jgi:endonuclease III